MYLYQSHLGGYYLDEFYRDANELYCEECGDSDFCEGWFESAVDALIYLADDIAIDNRGGYSLEDVLNTLSYFDDCPSYEEAKKIVRDNYTNYDEMDDEE